MTKLTHSPDNPAVLEPVKVDATKEEGRSLSLARWGVIGSIVYLLFLAPLAISRWSELWALDANEFGDLMAGTFSPLAFFWLVLGFFQQGQELRASVRALELQGEELRNSVEQQRQLVEVTKEELSFQMQRLAHEDEVQERAAMPILELQCTGNSNSSYAGHRSFSFRVANFGKDVTKFAVSFMGGGQTIQSCAKLGSGNPQTFKIPLPVEGTCQKTLRLGYINERGVPQAEYWVIRAVDGEVEVGPEDAMRAKHGG